MEAATIQIPRLVLGAALLLWGGICAHPFIGLLLAIIVEGSHWTQVRWDFRSLALQRAWQISVLLLFLTAALIWLGGDLAQALPRAFRWLPVIFLPLQFVQSYGIRSSMPLTAFSHFLRKKKEHAKRYQIPFREIRFHFGFAYFLAILLSAALGEHASHPVFYPTAILLIIWVVSRPLLSMKRTSLIGPLIVLPIAAIVGFNGDHIIDNLTNRLVEGRSRQNRRDYNREVRTFIGKLKEDKNSPEILWRLLPVQGELPKLLRVASYNAYGNTHWRADHPGDIGEGTEGFTELDSFGIENPYRITARADAETFIDGPTASAEDLPRFILRGSIDGVSLLPLPNSGTALVQPAQNLEISSFGTLRIDPRHPVADALMVYEPGLTTARPPWENRREAAREKPSLMVPPTEQPVLQALEDQLQLSGLPLDEKIQRMREYFSENFRYTRYDSVEVPNSDGGRARFISDFLTKQKRGHCEYFATAAVLLLREAGIPARYATGFAVVERDGNNIGIIRGIHAHAWAMAWDESRKTWIDVDVTPPDWTGMETPRTPPWQPLLDRLRIWRDNFLVWRTHPGNLAIAIALMALPFLAGAWLIGRRLWKSRRKLGTEGTMLLAFDRLPSPLQSLEKAARRRLGHRPESTPFGQWLGALREHLNEPADLDRALALHRQLRFDPDADHGAITSELEQLASRLAVNLRALPHVPRSKRPG